MKSHSHVILESLVECLHEIVSGVEITANLETSECAMDASGQILCHDAGFDDFNARLKPNTGN